MRNELGYYIRLSHADDDLGEDQYESDSITNQRELIHRYLAAHPEFSGWKIHEFVDDGYSGTSENRPEFQRMINLARHGQIRCIIVKDFSRFARNYITMDKLAAKLDAITKQIAAAEARRDEVDQYFTTDNTWLRTFVETGAVNELTPELIHQLIKRIDVYPDKCIKITFNYTDWMNPLLDCIEESKTIKAGDAPT